MIEVGIQYKELLKLLCKAILQRKLLKIYYESESSGRKDWRTIRPYMIWPNNKNNLALAGVPTEELQKFSKEKRRSGQYLLSQLITRLNEGQIQILSETFDDPGIPQERVDDTPTKVICRFIYDDESEKDLKKQWLKIKYI